MKYLNNVYNNHLCIGIKHGGHINEYLKNNMKTTSISNHEFIIHLCKYNYDSNIYNYITNYDMNSYIYDENTFTHISIIDKEIYSTPNINELIHNCYKWLITRGYLFIQVYDTIIDMKTDLLEQNKPGYVRNTHHYETSLETINNSRFYFVEKINVNNKSAHNYHEFIYYEINYLNKIASEYGFETIAHININNGYGIMILQKNN